MASFDGTDINNGTTLGLTGSDYPSTADRDPQTVRYGSRPGGRITTAQDGLATKTITGWVQGTSAANCEANLDALLAVYRRPRRRLILSQRDNRYWIATLAAPVQVQRDPHYPRYLTYQAKFLVEDPYARNPTPAGDVRTASLALAPNETTVYVQQYTVTPGGSAPAPLMAILTNQSGGVTPLAWGLSNLTATLDLAAGGSAAVRCLTTASVAAGGALILDGTRGELWSGALTNVTGWWPLDDASGTVLDFSGNSRDLSANGSPVYRQDGDVYGGAIDYDGSAAYHSSASAAFGYTSDFTFAAWVNPDAIGSMMGVAGRGTQNNGWMVNVSTGGFVQGWIGTSAATSGVTSRQTLTAGVWTHVCYTWEQAALRHRVYINGVLDATGTSGAGPSSAGTFTLGRASDITVVGATPRYFNGRIAGRPVALSRRLTDAQVLALYQRHLLAAVGAQGQAAGTIPWLDPTRGTTNTIELRADHATTAPTARASLHWIARWA